MGPAKHALQRSERPQGISVIMRAIAVVSTPHAVAISCLENNAWHEQQHAEVDVVEGGEVMHCKAETLLTEVRAV